MILVDSGTLELFEERRGFVLHPGEWLILEAGKTHGGLNDYPSNLSFFWLHFSVEGAFPELPRHGRLSRPETAKNYLQAFLAEQAQPDPDPVSLRYILQLLFRELWNRRENSLNETPSLLAQRARQLITAEYMTPLTTGGLARRLGCNADYLGRIYHFCFHESIAQTIMSLRLQRAAELLTDNKLAIKEIGTQLGFNDPSYFRRCFRRRFSMTPGQMRALRCHDHLNIE